MRLQPAWAGSGATALSSTAAAAAKASDARICKTPVPTGTKARYC